MKTSIILFCLLSISTGLFAQSPGDTVGTTQYIYQSNGSTGHRIAVDDSGGVHFAWMHAHPYPNNRDIYYNFLNNNGWLNPGVGEQVSFRNRDGYTQIAVTSDNRALIAYHNVVNAESVFCAVDAAPYLGAFVYYRVLNQLGNDTMMWPYVSVDRNNRIHLVASASSNIGESFPIGYTRSTDFGLTWTIPLPVDTLRCYSAMITSSSVSDKVAIVYTHPLDSVQNRNDLYFIESQDGINWDFSEKSNVTHYGGADSLFAYTDVDAIYDYNDDLHIIWNAQYVTPSGISDRAFLLHYDTESGTISEVCHVDVPHVIGCAFGSWNLAINKMSISADQGHNLLYTTYCRFDTSDCSADNLANGEIYKQRSQANGAVWTAPVDITNSHTPGCLAGNCASDVWPSMAEKIDNFVHISYFCFTGGPDFWNENGDSPFLYLKLPTGPNTVSEINQPADFQLSQNYPNPFNTSTNIKFTLDKAAEIDLSIYDITGAKIATLASGKMGTGTYSLIWDACRISSGVYYSKLSTNNGAISKKMILLK
jgi:hypothetical protein